MHEHEATFDHKIETTVSVYEKEKYTNFNNIADFCMHQLKTINCKSHIENEIMK